MSFPLLAMWNADMMGGAPTALSDHEATLRLKTTYQDDEEERWKPGSLKTMELTH